eukprot:TRINITY_DN7511_c0_g1_i1.p1 TRINITY_DN7511_c0_g1~~TRINITY_DN7511_c0_g1_i1.p1  ORF type:complete len:226 (-),score=72.48 TRINITY_DN7511_c0_g1_i1:1521-2198(-)
MATVSYPPLAVSSVAEMLDPSRPLVKSTLPLTRPRGPRFVDPSEAERRKLERQQKKATTTDGTSRIYSQRLNERKFLKAQYEFDREKRIAEQTIYKKEKADEWKGRFANSPFLVDLVADNERIEEELVVRSQEEARKKRLQEVKKKKVRTDIIVKSLSEVPVLDQARAQKRMLAEQERVEKARKDVEKATSVFDRKQRDYEMMERERLEKLELKAAASPMNKTPF